MSWDLLAFACKSAPPNYGELPDDWTGDPLGSSDQVREKLSIFVPGIEWTDKAWGILELDRMSIEFNLGGEELCDHFSLHIRGVEVQSQFFELLTNLTRQFGWYFFDITKGEWLHLVKDQSKGFIAFKEFQRDAL